MGDALRKAVEPRVSDILDMLFVSRQLVKNAWLIDTERYKDGGQARSQLISI